MNERQRKYKEYLKSDWWKKIRLERIKIDKFCCVICKSRENLNVHHLNYYHLGDEDIKRDLITLCEKCHCGIHKKTIKLRRKKKKQNKPFSGKIKKIKGICKLTEKDINKKCPAEFLISV